MTTQIQTINFHNQLLSTFEHNSIYYVAMKPICENIGLNWDGQRQRIQRDEVLSQGTVIITAPTNSGDQQMLCLPIDYLNGWLFGIDVKRVKPEIRDLLITYKKECYKALSDYWMKGKAERKTTTDERTGLRQAVSKLVSQKGLIYSDAYSLIHQRFNVQHIDELTPEQIPMAVEYIHKIVLEGELITDTSPKVKEDEIVVPYNLLYALYRQGQRGRQLGYEVSILLNSLLRLLGEEHGRPKLTGLAYDCQAQCIHWLDLAEKIIDKRNLTGVRA
ncbi:phage antirepressor N-terminal domain-containing protein [Pasteurella multocida]|uniref:phage antirepressor N-terminal domain-containing protein n=1 Tax=Pasteurella multocida TaxID=747 RepID=UPI0013F4BAFE|nr:phage antirepressor N-terminal domain-containing protein [Pasteurella multocida]MDY0577899.1 phage antirepressor N-terminal domain-containing protein [Pasteurella multocida]MEB3472344.1 phage antirepressor N-terminal domain-containing protein [Pasteurella multocida]MEB3486767.1 phage antirepressor N-terminal domain-containing protein [Pasteurella multocida]MEB3497456.1 phage antirepressor N-terminal domain-containing protein [Pasteurella multocida]MEB3502293.1 phage antirepressor N-terminal